MPILLFHPLDLVNVEEVQVGSYLTRQTPLQSCLVKLDSHIFGSPRQPESEPIISAQS